MKSAGLAVVGFPACNEAGPHPLQPQRGRRNTEDGVQGRHLGMTSARRAVLTERMFIHISQARLNPDSPWQSGREESCESSPGSGLKFMSIACTFP